MPGQVRGCLRSTPQLPPKRVHHEATQCPPHACTKHRGLPSPGPPSGVRPRPPAGRLAAAVSSPQGSSLRARSLSGQAAFCTLTQGSKPQGLGILLVRGPSCRKLGEAPGFIMSWLILLIKCTSVVNRPPGQIAGQPLAQGTGFFWASHSSPPACPRPPGPGHQPALRSPPTPHSTGGPCLCEESCGPVEELWASEQVIQEPPAAPPTPHGLAEASQVP